MRLTAREYKLLLKPSSIGEDIDAAAADAFLSDQLEPIARRQGLDLEGGLEKKPARRVRFLDTAACVLTRAGYVLRIRREKDARGEVTLKLRMPDLFVVAATELPGRDGDAETKFEEDIAPLEVQTPGGKVTVADPPSIRSRFSLSTRQDTRRDPGTLGDLFELYPTLAKNLAGAGRRSDPLLGGPSIRERVFEGAGIDLGGAQAALALTAWRFETAGPVRRVAEVSFKVRLADGEMGGGAARRALGLFQAMQSGLTPELRYPSKTRMALPDACKARGAHSD